MLKYIYLLILDVASITGNAIIDTILLSIIALFSFVLAFKITGGLAGALDYNSSLMHIVHWIFRIAIAVGLIWLFRKVMIYVIWFFMLPWWIVSLGVVGFISLVILAFIAKKKITH